MMMGVDFANKEDRIIGIVESVKGNYITLNIEPLPEYYIPSDAYFQKTMLDYETALMRSYLTNTVFDKWIKGILGETNLTIYVKLHEIEEKINKLVNKIFQENPSLP